MKERWAARLDRDLDNLRAAHDSAVRAGDLSIAAGLVATLREYAFRRVRYEIAGWAEATMQMAGFESSPTAPLVLGVAAYGRWVRGDLGTAIALGHRSVTLAEELDVASSGLAERVLGNALFYSGETPQALYWMERMAAAAEASGSRAAQAHALYMTSVAATSVGETAAELRSPPSPQRRLSAAVRRRPEPRPPTPTVSRSGRAKASRPRRRCASPLTSATRVGTGGSGPSR